jgi:hypothetical protein
MLQAQPLLPPPQEPPSLLLEDLKLEVNQAVLVPRSPQLTLPLSGKSTR